MDIIRRLPTDVANRIIPYTYNTQPPHLLADIRHYTKSLHLIINFYKRQIWWQPMSPPHSGRRRPPRHITGLLFDLTLRSRNVMIPYIHRQPIKNQKKIVKLIWGKLAIPEREHFIRAAKAPTP